MLSVAWCHDRFCVPCQRNRAARLAANLNALTADRDLRLVTLTLKHTDTPLSSQLNRLTKSFRRLRQSTPWKKTQKGGVCCLELKRSAHGDRWHPHLHAIVEGQFLSQSELAEEWKRITKDSYIVDIRRIRPGGEAVRYVTKYASKGLTVTGDERKQALAEAITALGGKRLVQCFGTWKNERTTDAPSEEAWKRWMTLEELLYQAAAGLPSSVLLLAKLKENPNFRRRIDAAQQSLPPPTGHHPARRNA